MRLFFDAKLKELNLKKNLKKSNSSNLRPQKKWENRYKISKKIFEVISDLAKGGDLDLVRDACVQMRNPVVFDNQVSDSVFELPYRIPGTNSQNLTKDHLVGMSNIVLYIHINGIDKRWNSVDDFINTLKALQVLLPIPKSLNNKKSYKSWQFDIQTINECIKWWKKLENEGITHLEDNTGKLVPVMDVYNEWYQNNKIFL